MPNASQATIFSTVGAAGDVFERRQCRIKREKRSGSDLPIDKLQRNADRGLVTTGSARALGEQAKISQCDVFV